ncbi:MAG: QueT transporter family protein [Lachnospiraceae bacterium]|jgi:Predicted membrane protein|nr:QueT transporter family protein [Lachnospiraceae bacterium]MCI9658532.1 QueT transporter family protein [Lachnospiraceae bacterium]
MKENNVLFLTQAALIAAVYVVLCVVFAPISYGEVQVRVAEALVILPYFTPAAIPGLFIGCLLSNLIGGSILMDVVFGSLATLLGAVGSYYLRKNKVLVLLPPIIANTLIVPFVLYYGYGVPLPIPFMMLTVGIGEVIAVAVLGTILLNVLNRYRGVLFGTPKLLS